MFHSLKAGALIAAVAFAPAAAFAEAQWHTVRGAWNDFAAEMPGQPKYSTSTMKTSRGDAYVSHTHLLESGTKAFVIQAAEYPPSVDVSNPRGNLQAGIDNAAKRMEQGRFVSVQWRTVAGRTAVEAVGQRGRSAVRTFSVIRGRRIYALTYAGPPGSARGADANRFIQSFRFAQ